MNLIRFLVRLAAGILGVSIALLCLLLGGFQGTILCLAVLVFTGYIITELESFE